MSHEEVADEVLFRMVDRLAEKRMRSGDLFRKIDADGGGEITSEELQKGLVVELNFTMTKDETVALMSRLDKDGGGDVSMRELDRALKAAEKMPRKPKGDHQGASAGSGAGNKLKKQGLTEQDIDEFRQIFCLFKQLSRQRVNEAGETVLCEWDDSGSISVEELEQLLESVGMKLNEDELAQMVREIDADGSGDIDFTEFCEKMAKEVQVEYPPADIAKSFKAFAKNSPDGMIRVEDLRSALKTYMFREMIDSEVDELLLHYKDCFFKRAGEDTEMFSYQDYIELMSPTVSADE